MAVTKMSLLLVVSLCTWITVLIGAETDDVSLQKAQETLLNAGIGVDLEESHIEDLKEHDNLPAAYQRVIESLHEEAKTCDDQETYRRADGVCNNLVNPLHGAVLHYQERLLPNAYLDEANIPRLVGKKQQYLSSARTVSVNCFPPNKETDSFLDKETTQMSMQWGQYLDHDIVFTEVMPGSGCCDDPRHTCIHKDSFTGNSECMSGPCFPIGIPDGDRYFNETCMNFKRSFSIDVKGVHEQINGVTAFMDASTVYGSSQIHQDSLRTMYKGLLKVSDDNTLPELNHFKCRKHVVNAETCPFAGDARVNVFPGLTLLHLMFVREHNRLAEKLAELNPHWIDEKIFQETRRIIIGLHQKITYEEYLPHVVGEDAMEFFQLHSSGNFRYDPDVNPGILNEFAVAAFRFGHSQINGLLGGQVKADISNVYFQPWKAQKSESTVKKMMKEQCRQHAQKTNQFFTTEVTDKLFLDVDAPGHSTDLAARNVQRGRDHGVQPYLDYLDLAIKRFIKPAEVTYNSYKLPQCLKEDVYDSVADVDLFVGGLYEDPMPGGLVGPTFAYIIGEQFRRLKFGDRFFYEREDPVVGFSPAQLSEIKSLSLAHVMCRNTKNTKVQPDIFAIGRKQNKARHCSTYQDIDLSAWKELAPVNASSTSD